MLGLVISLSPPSLTSAVMRSSVGVGETGWRSRWASGYGTGSARAPYSLGWIRSRR
jgi:hypothetical protein